MRKKTYSALTRMTALLLVLVCMRSEEHTSELQSQR